MSLILPPGHETYENDVQSKTIALDSDTMANYYSQDAEPFLENNKEWQNDFNNYRGEHFWKVADIPLIFIMKWLNEEGLNIMRPDHFEHIVKKKLNDPDFKFLKTVPGRI